jgi:pilus assembly protein CpaC
MEIRRNLATHSTYALAKNPLLLETEPMQKIIFENKSRKGTKMKTGLIASSLITLALLMGSLNSVTTASYAADSNEAVEAITSDDKNFVRLALNKSAVVKLPAEATDVIIGNPGVVDAVVRKKDTAYLFARTIGETNIFFLDAAGNQILSLDLEVQPDSLGLKKLLDRKLKGNSITVEAVNNTIVLSGEARSGVELHEAMKIANAYIGKAFNGDENYVLSAMTVAGVDQVMLRVKVIEVQRSTLKEFGINLQAILRAGSFAFDLASYTIPNTGGGGVGIGQGGYSGSNVNVDGVIRAMEGAGLVRTLAEPNLTAVNGATATFNAGGEYPYQSCSTIGGANNCSVIFRPYGVSLSFSPTVMEEDQIRLSITSRNSDLGENTSAGPVINTRETTTALQLPSGGSMMIAGMISESTRQKVNSTPGLKQLPILGALFRSHEFVTQETELVVIVTPVLVRPTTASKLVAPDKNFNPPSDRQRVLLGRLNKVYGGSSKVDGEYHGNVGFIVE